MTINETHFHGERKVNIPGYKTYSRNRVDRASGSILTSIICSDSSDSIRVEESVGKIEFVMTRHSQFVTPINVLNIYGQQECRNTTEDIEKQWNEVMEVIAKVEARNEYLAIVGDLNCAVGDTVPGNSDRVSKGGEILRRFLESKEYTLVNNTEKVVGGPWTREDPVSGTKSVLDMLIVSTGLLKYIDKMEIDNERKFTPFKQINGKKLSYPDHYAILTTFKNLLRKTNTTVRDRKKIRIWNTHKKGGWHKYNELTSNNLKLNEIANSPSEDPDFLMNAIEKVLATIKYQ